MTIFKTSDSVDFAPHLAEMRWCRLRYCLRSATTKGRCYKKTNAAKNASSLCAECLLARNLAL